MEKVRCLIIGGGPAGYTSAIYASRAGLAPVLYEGMEPGGQLTTTTVVENFPGFPEGIDANVLMSGMREQALRFGADIRNGAITSVEFSSRPLKVTVIPDTESNPMLSLSRPVHRQSILAFLPKGSSGDWASLPALPVTASSTAARMLR